MNQVLPSMKTGMRVFTPRLQISRINPPKREVTRLIEEITTYVSTTLSNEVVVDVHLATGDRADTYV